MRAATLPLESEMPCAAAAGSCAPAEPTPGPIRNAGRARVRYSVCSPDSACCTGEGAGVAIGEASVSSRLAELDATAEASEVARGTEVALAAVDVGATVEVGRSVAFAVLDRTSEEFDATVDATSVDSAELAETLVGSI